MMYDITFKCDVHNLERGKSNCKKSLKIGGFDFHTKGVLTTKKMGITHIYLRVATH